MTFGQKLITEFRSLAFPVKKAGLAAALCVPIILCCLFILTSGDRFPSGDFDMQIQMTEAAKITILEFKQFPSWNPWVSGGVPLFADPQFGLFTPQTLLSLMMSSVMAWKLTFVIYLLAGFLSMLTLLNFLTRQTLSEFSAKLFLNILTAYLWVFNSFFWIRFNGGHLTFLLLLLLPLGIYLVTSFDSSKYRPIHMTAFITYLFYSAVHYPTIFTLMILGAVTGLLLGVEFVATIKKSGWMIYKRFYKLRSFKRLIFLSYTVAVAIILSAPRLLPTLRYIQGNAAKREDDFEKFFGIISGLRALFASFGSYSTPGATYGPFEATNFIGLFTAVALITACCVGTLQLKKRVGKKSERASLIPYVITFSLIGIGSFAVGLGGKLFHLIQNLPVLSMMRVSTRYFLVTALCILIVTALFSSYIKSRRTLLAITFMLFISTIQVIQSNLHWSQASWRGAQLDTNTMASSLTWSSVTPPEPVKQWETAPVRADYALTKATRKNKTQLITDNALVPTAVLGTARCDMSEKDCSFIVSHNAKLLFWSPNKITLERTASGPIELNMNPGDNWIINGVDSYQGTPSVMPTGKFIITDGADHLTLLYKNKVF